MKPLRNENITIRDIAERAGMSTATVSRYLNGKVLNPKRRHAQLDKIISESGYQLPRQKVKLRILRVRGRGDAPEGSIPFQLEQFLCEQARAEGMELFSVLGGDRDEVLRQLESLGCAGALTGGGMDDLPVPTVVLEDDHYYGERSCVNCDNAVGMVKGLKYLRRMGHGRVAYFCDYALDAASGDPRRHFMAQAYRLAGLDYDPQLVWAEGFKPFEHQPVIERAVKRFLSLEPRPTAIFSVGDTYGIGLYDALRGNGMDIPGDMSVLGFDGVDAFREMLNPPLTSVTKPLGKIAAEALRLLKYHIESGDNTPRRTLVAPDIVEGGSVARRDDGQH